MEIGSLLTRHAKYRPDHLCLVFEDQRFSYAAFNAEVNRLANALLKVGLRKGDKVATVGNWGWLGEKAPETLVTTKEAFAGLIRLQKVADGVKGSTVGRQCVDQLMKFHKSTGT